jgi:predicted esterase
MNDANLQTDLNITAEIKLYYDLYIPETGDAGGGGRSGPLPLLIAVHGYGAHKRYMMREARLVAPENFAIVSIQAPHQHFREVKGTYKSGFGWLTDFKAEESIALHQKFVLDLIAKLEGQRLIDRTKIYLYGFSQACALNFRFAFTHPGLLRGVIGVCGGIPSDLETNASYKPTGADAFYLYSDRDEFYPLEKYRAFDQKLAAFLPRYQSKLYAAAHEINDAMRSDLKNWLAALALRQTRKNIIV